MAWNEPGGKGQDPRGGGNNNGGPPDLDEIWRRLRNRFGGSGNGNGRARGGSGGPPPALLYALIPIVLVVWLATGFYIVQPGEKGVLLRFGAYQKTAASGLHWHLPYPIANVIKVDTQKVRSAQYGGLLLTKDENIVDVRVSLQYRVTAPKKYLFNVRNPEQTVEQSLRSAVREVVATSRMNQVIQEGMAVSDVKQKALESVDLKKAKNQVKEEDALKEIKPELRAKIKAQKETYPDLGKRSRPTLPENIRTIMQAMLNEYHIGMKVMAVNVEYSQPPESVQPAFEAAIMAREEKVKKKNLARAYARKVVARAKGKAAQKILEARGYREAKISRAHGQADRFLALLEEYRQAPEVTRKRLYLETMGEVLEKSNLVLMGNDKGAPLMYLPLQKMFSQNMSDQKGSGNDQDSKDVIAPDDYSLEHAQSDGSNSLRNRGRSR